MADEKNLISTQNIQQILDKMNELGEKLEIIIDKYKETKDKKYLDESSNIRDQILLLFESFFKFNLNDLISELANIWGIDISDISYEVSSNIDTKVTDEEFKDLTLDSMIKKGYERYPFCEKMCFKITNNKNHESLNFYCPIALDEIQADGKPMREHLSLNKKNYNPHLGLSELKLKLDDLSKFIPLAKVGDVAWLSCNDDSDNQWRISNDILSKAIAKASEKYQAPNPNPEDQSVM